MPWTNNASIDALRLQYNAAVTAHKSSRGALINARMDGAAPSDELIDAEAKASALLEDVRAKLLAAMTTAITGGGSDAEPPTRI